MPNEAQQTQLAEEFRDRLLSGERFGSIMQARQVAEELWGERVRPGTQSAKQVEQAAEQGLVRAGRSLIEEGGAKGQPAEEIYDRLVDLYERQPRLGTRSSSSIEKQQYSTPMPVAYLASRMAGIEPGQQVYEPTAGHGAIPPCPPLIRGGSRGGCDRSQATVNELDDDRAADLRRQGYQVSQHDAASYRPGDRSMDVVIANPPFGRRQQDGRAERFTIGGAEGTPVQTSELDHAIASPPRSPPY